MNVLCAIFWLIATTNLTKLQINTFMTTPETALAHHNPNPYNVQVPVVGKPNLTPPAGSTPNRTPLGVQPHYRTPSEYWPWDYGNS